MNRLRLIIVPVFSILIFILYIFPAPDGILYSVLKVLTYILVVGALFYFSGFTTPTFQQIQKNDDNEIETIDNVKVEVNVSEQYKQLLHLIFSMISSINDSYKTAFYVYNKGKNSYGLQFSNSDIFQQFIPISNEIVRTVLHHDEGMFFQQTDIITQWNELFQERSWRGSECIIGTKVMYKDIPLGFLISYIDHFSKIKSYDKNLIYSMGFIVSMGMEKLENIDKLSIDNLIHAQIAGLLNSLDIQSEPKLIGEKVRNICRTFMEYDKMMICQKLEDQQSFTVLLEDGYIENIDSETGFLIHDSIFGKVYEENKTIELVAPNKHLTDSKRFPGIHETKLNFQSLLISPIKVNGETLFSISFEKKLPEPFTTSEKELLELISITFGSILSWQLKYDVMKESAMRDGLTTLLNRKAFMERFDEEISRADRYQHEVVFAILDLDKFKRINDTYGHLYGDYVIKETARIIKENVRNIDVVGRYGGEEFAILLINTSAEKIAPVANRIINKIAKFPYRYDHIDVNMTISCGLAEFPKDAETIENLIAKADEAMYNSKAKGGNLVSIYSTKTLSETVHENE